mgnify:CR=1 FL=1
MMIEYSKDAAMLHLKENWDIVDSPVGFLGVNKIYEFYNHVLAIKVIKKIFYRSTCRMCFL